MADSPKPPDGPGASEPLRLLVLEDEQADGEVMVAALRHDGLDVQWRRVESEAGFRAALHDRPDVILADFVVPGFGALDALAVLRELPDAPPLIVVTGKLHDTAAVESMKSGAEDYLLKDRLARLPQAVRRALRESAAREGHAAVAAALRKSQERYRMDFEQELVGMFASTPDGRILDCNAALAHTLGFDHVEDVLRANAAAMYSDAARRDAFVEKVRTHGRLQLIEEELRRVDGTPVHVLESVLGVFDDDGQLQEIRGYMVDITTLTRARTERDSLAAAMEQAAEAVIITDTAAVIRYVNAAYARLTGYSREEALGENPRIVKSGAQDADFYRRLWSTLTSGGMWTGRIVNRRKDGTLFTADATISPVRDGDGSVVGYLSFQKDVTHEIELETHLARSQKLEAVGGLAAGVAHDFNNILTVITTSAQLSLDPAATLDEARADLQEILNAARRGGALSRQLLAFSRQQILEPAVLDPNAVIREGVKLLSRVIGEDIDLRLDLDPAVGRVKADPAQLQMVILNLSINARDAMPQGGRLSIRTASVRSGGDDQAPAPPGVGGPCVLIEVADTGYGMDAAVQARVFEPFFTTKKEGRGSGLGLAMVYGTVTQSGGSITVESAPGRGTTFRIYLPVAAAEAETGQVAAGHAARHEGGTVLLVEDDAPVRRGVQRSLESMGYKVEAYGNPEEAIRWSQDPAIELDLVVTDLIMPGMDGASLAARLRVRHSGIAVLFISGYAPKRIFPDGDLPAGTSFLAKPFTRDQLADKVLEAMGRS